MWAWRTTEGLSANPPELFARGWAGVGGRRWGLGRGSHPGVGLEDVRPEYVCTYKTSFWGFPTLRFLGPKPKIGQPNKGVWYEPRGAAVSGDLCPGSGLAAVPLQRLQLDGLHEERI